MSQQQRHRLALEMVLAGSSDVAVARAIGVSRKTIYRWRTGDGAFRTVLMQRRQAALDAAGDRFQGLLDLAIDVLEKQLRNAYEPISARSARTVLALSGLARARREPSER